MPVAHLVQVNAHLVGGAQPLSRGTAEGRGGTVLFIAHVPTVVFAVAQPARRDAHFVGALEVAGAAGDGRACVVLIGAVLAVRMAVTLPLVWYAETVGLALELVVVAKARTSSGCRSQSRTLNSEHH